MLLLVTDRNRFGKQLVDALLSKGVYLFRASYETGAFYCREKDTGGVIFDGVPSLAAAEFLCKSLKNEYPELPTALLVTRSAIPNAKADCIIRESDPEAIFSRVLEFATEVCGFRTSTLSTFHLTVGESKDEVYYKGYPLALSQKEYELLRILFYRAPKWTSADDLMELCYPEGDAKIDALFALVSRINAKVKESDGAPLILSERKNGYRLRGAVMA